MAKWVYFNVPAASPVHGCFLAGRYYRVDDEWAKQITVPDSLNAQPARFATKEEVQKQAKKKRLIPPEYDTEQNATSEEDALNDIAGEDGSTLAPPKGAVPTTKRKSADVS